MTSAALRSFLQKYAERLGHIIATPVAHICLKSLPSRIGAILDIALKDVEEFYTAIVRGIECW